MTTTSVEIPAALNSLENIKPSHLGHHEVEEEDVVFAGQGFCQALFGVGEGLDSMALAGECPGAAFCDGGLVVNDEHVL